MHTPIGNPRVILGTFISSSFLPFIVKKMEKGTEASGLSRRSRAKPLLVTTVILFLVAVAVCAVVAISNTAQPDPAADLPNESRETFEVEARSLLDDEPQPEDREVQFFTT